MARAEAARASTLQSILVGGQEVECRLVRSSVAKKLRIKVGPDGIEVVVPEGRHRQDAAAFVAKNQTWVVEQLARARRLRALRRPVKSPRGQILFRGESVPLKVERSELWQAPNKVVLENGVISITHGPGSGTTLGRSLENWLRKQARECIERHVEDICKRVKRRPKCIYVMDQRTRWGNCSALGNLSFSWRLIMAPDYVLRYIVTHEVVHLAIPDHSQRFWLTVQSLCPAADRARQWLVANEHHLRSALEGLPVGG